MSKFSPSNLAALRNCYATIHDLPDGSHGFKRAVDRVARMTTEQRNQIEKAGVRWLAPIARAIRLNAMDKPLLHSGGHIRDQGRGYL